VEPTLSCLSQALFGYARANQWPMARGILNIMLQQYQTTGSTAQSSTDQSTTTTNNPSRDRRTVHLLGNNDNDESVLLVASAQTILDSLRQGIVLKSKPDIVTDDSDDVNKEAVVRAVTEAEAVVEQMVAAGLCPPATTSHGTYKHKHTIPLRTTFTSLESVYSTFASFWHSMGQTK
jgi:hypothetical protein